MTRPAARHALGPACALALALLAGVSGCSRPAGGATSGAFPSLPDAGPGGAFPQHVEVVVDGRRAVFDGDARDFPATASFADGGRSLTVTVRDPEGRFTLSFTVRGAGDEPVQAGDLRAAACPPTGDTLPTASAGPAATRPPSPCAWRGTAALLERPATAVDDADPPPIRFRAWDAPALGLSPATLDLQGVEETVRPGDGPGRRLRGRFEGDFAALALDDAGRPHVRGPVHRVSGTIDVYASLR